MVSHIRPRCPPPKPCHSRSTWVGGYRRYLEIPRAESFIYFLPDFSFRWCITHFSFRRWSSGAKNFPRVSRYTRWLWRATRWHPCALKHPCYPCVVDVAQPLGVGAMRARHVVSVSGSRNSTWDWEWGLRSASSARMTGAAPFAHRAQWQVQEKVPSRSG